MKEQYTSPEVKLVVYIAEEPIASREEIIDGDSFFRSAAKVNTDDIPFFFDWLS